MSLSTDEWNTALSGLSFLLAVYAIVSSNSRAGAEDQATLKAELGLTRENQAATNARLGERLQAVETKLENAISHDDLEAIHKRNNDEFRIVHARVDEMHHIVAQIRSDLGEIKGILRAGLPPIRNSV